MTDTKFSKLSKLVAIAKEHTQRMQAEGETVIKEALIEFFLEFPDVESISWDQYTPYFNDGEQCDFGVHTPYIQMIEGASSPSNYPDEDRIYEFCLDDSPIKSTLKELRRYLQTLTAVLYQTWGDHVTVTATREIITVEKCKHE